MKRLLLPLAFAPTIAWAQPSAGPGPQPQPGCVVNVACQAASLAFSGKTAIFSATDGTVQFKNNAATRQLSLDFSGIPVPTGTGTPTITAGSTDTAGEVTSGTTATSVIITFSSSKTNAPFCLVTPQTQLVAFAYTISTSAITITQTATTGEKIDYFCVQR